MKKILATFLLSIAASTASAQDVWIAIAQQAWATYQTTAEGQCVQLAAQCDPRNIAGTARRCHEIRRRVNNFMRSPNGNTAEPLWKDTRSNRTVCMARHFMGDSAWDEFENTQK